jgi:hypothetical protein
MLFCFVRPRRRNFWSELRSLRPRNLTTSSAGKKRMTPAPRRGSKERTCLSCARGKSERPAGTAGLHQTFHARAEVVALVPGTCCYLCLVRTVTYVSGRTEEKLELSGTDQDNLERAKGFEPSTPTLARSCSTPELHPHPRDWRRMIGAGPAELCQKRTSNATARLALSLGPPWSNSGGIVPKSTESACKSRDVGRWDSFRRNCLRSAGQAEPNL